MLAAVRDYNIEGYILGSTPPPPRTLSDNVLNPDFNRLMRYDQFLVHWLMNLVSETMIGYIVHCLTVVEIWRVVANLFANQSKARIL